jgi:hypothetical protein
MTLMARLRFFGLGVMKGQVQGVGWSFVRRPWSCQKKQEQVI